LATAVAPAFHTIKLEAKNHARGREQARMANGNAINKSGRYEKLATVIGQLLNNSV
jgi:hypothetical protein